MRIPIFEVEVLYLALFKIIKITGIAKLSWTLRIEDNTIRQGARTKLLHYVEILFRNDSNEAVVIIVQTPSDWTIVKKCYFIDVSIHILVNLLILRQIATVHKVKYNHNKLIPSTDLSKIMQ